MHQANGAIFDFTIQTQVFHQTTLLNTLKCKSMIVIITYQETKLAKQTKVLYIVSLTFNLPLALIISLSLSELYLCCNAERVKV